MGSSKKLTVVVLFCNRFIYTESVVESIFHQYSDFNIVFIDNGSVDGTKDYLFEAARCKADTVLVRHEKNIGKPAALDEVIRQAETEFVLTLDGDILLKYTNTVANLLIYYALFEQKYSDIGLLSPMYIPLPGILTPDDSVRANTPKTVLGDCTYYVAQAVNVAGGCQLFRKENYVKVGGYKLTGQFYGQDDVSLFLRLREKNLLSVYVEDPCITHLGDADRIHFPEWFRIKIKAHTSKLRGKIFKDHSNLFI